MDVDSNWERLSCDVTHYGAKKFLTIVDCEPSRFAIWRLIRTEDAEVITRQFEQIFREWGAPKELLLDNGATFRSKA